MEWRIGVVNGYVKFVGGGCGAVWGMVGER